MKKDADIFSMPKKSNSASSLVRQERIYSFLEATKTAKSLSQITEYLNSSHNWNFSRKTIERDVEAMAYTHGIVQVAGHPAGYKISEDFTRQYNLRFDEQQLQMLALVMAIGAKQSPDFIQPIVSKIDLTIHAALPKALRMDLEEFRKLCIVRGTPSGRSKIKLNDHMEVLCEALRKKKLIVIKYESPYDSTKNKKLRKFAPIAIEVFGGTYYLLAEDHDAADKKVKRLALSRIKEISITGEEFKPQKKGPEKFNEAFGGLSKNELTKLEIECGHFLGTYLMENEMHASQKIEKVGKTYRASFEVPMGAPFLRFLAGFSGDIHRIEPKEVADELKLLLREGIEALSA